MEHTFTYDAFLRADASERLSEHRGAVFKFYLFSLTSGLFGTGYDYLLEEFGIDRTYKRESFTAKLLAGDILGFSAAFFRMDIFQLAVIGGGLFWLTTYTFLGASLWLGLRDSRIRIGLILLLMLACYFILLSLGPQARARYRIPSYPFLFLLIGFSFDAARSVIYKWANKIKIHKKHSWLFDFIDYSKSRIATGVVGTVILFVFADTMGFNAWLVNLVWIPFSFIMSFSLIQIFARRIETSTTGKLRRLLLKKDDESQNISGDPGIQ